MVQVWPLFLHVSPKRCGLRDGGWLTTTANFPSDITPGAIAERLDYLIWVYFVESTNANLLLLVSSPARPTYLVAGRNTWAQNISRVLSQGLGVFQHSGILANLFSAWASYMHMDMYIEIQSHICVCVCSAPVPRNYPPAFGKKIFKIHSRLVSTRVLREATGEFYDAIDGQTLFSILEWGDLWNDADMVSCLAWLRANKHLNLGSWRDLFPSEL